MFPERLTHEHPGDFGQGLKMEAGGIDRGQKHEKEVRRFAIHGVEVDPFKTAAEAQQEPGELGASGRR